MKLILDLNLWMLKIGKMLLLYLSREKITSLINGLLKILNKFSKQLLGIWSSSPKPSQEKLVTGSAVSKCLILSAEYQIKKSSGKSGRKSKILFSELDLYFGYNLFISFIKFNKYHKFGDKNFTFSLCNWFTNFELK